MGLHQPLLNTGTGGPVRYQQSVGVLQQELEGKICCKYTLQTHVSPKTKPNFKHREAQRGTIKDHWMGMRSSLCSVATSPVWHRDSPSKLGSHSSEPGACRQKTVPRSCLTRHGLKQHSGGNLAPSSSAHPASSGTPTAGCRGQLPGAARGGSSCCPPAQPSSCSWFSAVAMQAAGMEILEDSVAGRCCKAPSHLLSQGNDQMKEFAKRQR